MNTATRNQPEFGQYIKRISEMVANLPDDKLRENYSIPNLEIGEWVAISIFDGGFSSIAWRPKWNNNCRILNRFFKVPSYRFENTKRIVSLETQEMIEQQLQVAKQLDFDCAFMSRETKTQAFNHYKKYLPQQWYVPSKRYVMTDNSNQHIMWTPLNRQELDMEIEQ